MKQIILYTILILLNEKCSETKASDTQQQAATISVAADFTDKKKLWPTPEIILRTFHCDQYPDAAATFKLYCITDISLNPTYSSLLPSGDITNKANVDDDPEFRKKAIVGFYNSVSQDFKDAYKQFDTTGKMEHTEAWTTICDILRQLSVCTSERRMLLIFSDLQENGDFDSYRLPNMSTQRIVDHLSNVASVPKNLSGIRVVIIYQPTSRSDDKRFNAMFLAYKMIIERQGGTIDARADMNSLSL